MRVAWILFALVALALPAAADSGEAKPVKPVAEKPPPPPLDPSVQALLTKIEKEPGARKAAIEELNKLAAQHVASLGGFLTRAHATPAADRKKVLEAIEAEVPDDKGHFTTPKRKTDEENKKSDELDWLASLDTVDATLPGVGEVIVDVAVIRALAGTSDMAAAYVLFDSAFNPETMLYRDECGRYIRKMEPYCIPALIKESQGKDFDRRRYATYQLERLDRQDAFKALGATAGDEAVQIAVLDVFRTTKHREAVHAVWSQVNADSPRVRKAARDAWMAYVSGPPPPPAPKKKLMLPGGKLTKKEKPLWLTYRELADNELRKALNEYLHEDYPLVDPTLDDTDEWKRPKTVKIDVVEKTTQLFEFFDKQRAEKEAQEFTAARVKAGAGDFVAATAMLDRMLVANPDRADRAEMASMYLTLAKQLESKSQWVDASAAYSKAHGLDPTGATAKDALAAHYYTLGKSLEAAGKDGGAAFRQAIALKPDYAPAKTAARESASVERPVWLLYLAALSALAAFGLFATAMVRRGRERTADRH